MEQTAVIRAMRPEDLASVLEIQSCCYEEAKQESGPSFLAKLEASPETCYLALVAGEPAGYLVAVPAEADHPPPRSSGRTSGRWSIRSSSSPASRRSMRPARSGNGTGSGRPNWASPVPNARPRTVRVPGT